MILAAIFLFAWTLSLAGLLVTAYARTRSRSDASPTAAIARGSSRPRLLVVRPCSGDEVGLEARLTSVLATRGAHEVASVVAVHDLRDTAWPTVARAVATLNAGGHPAQAVVTHANAANHKAGQLERALLAANEAWDVVVVADSDVDLSGFDLDALVAPLCDAHAGLAWAPPTEVGAVRTLGDRMTHAVLAGSLHAFPLLSALDPSGVVGKLFAIRRDALAAIGGFGAVSDVLGEDVALAQALRVRGYGVVRVAALAPAARSQRTTAGTIARFARWMQVVRGQRPLLLLSYPLFFFATTLITLSALFLAVRAPDSVAAKVALASAALAQLIRLLLALLARRVSERPATLVAALADSWLAETTLGLAFIVALTSRRFTWRGRVLELSRGGKLLPALQARAAAE